MSLKLILKFEHMEDEILLSEKSYIYRGEEKMYFLYYLTYLPYICLQKILLLSSNKGIDVKMLSIC